jgi:RNA polymerase sigma-70 factor (ECF subfamily)
MNDDQQAINRVLAGDVDAFRILVVRYEQAVFCAVRNLVPDAGDCEDVAQDVFLAAYSHLGSFDPRRASFVTWLLTIARNTCYRMRQKKRPLLLESLPEGTDRNSPECVVEQEETFRLLDEALAALPFEQRAVFVLAEIQGLPLEEVGTIEGVRLGTVKSRLHRAREKLRRAFRPALEPP